MAKSLGTKDLIKLLLWVYIGLLMIEGALRKWFLPFLSEPLLIIRDPIVLLIYLLALRGNFFPMNGFIAATGFLAFMSFVFGAFSGNSSVIVTLYGMRINYLQIPLIFVIGRVLDYKDCVQIGKVLIWLAIPQVMIMAAQFSLPQGSFINRQVGGGEGIMGALGRYRPPGTFAFITGPAAYFPLVLAFVIGFVMHEGKRFTWLCAIGAICTLLAIPVSISRLLALSCALVLVAGTYAFYRLPNPPKMIVRGVTVGAIALVLVPLLPVFDTATETFTERWVSSTGGDVEGVKEEVLDRYFTGMFIYPLNALGKADLTGGGIGVGSNVGAKLLTGTPTFLMGESEWEKAILELGPFLGLGFIALRIGLVVFILRFAISALGRGNALPLLIFSACFLLILNGQWGPPTILGFAMLGGGLSLAATKTSSVEKKTPQPAPKPKRTQRLPIHLAR